jgi:hypothetical protein
MILPDDVAGIRHEWIRFPSHGWTERQLRDLLVRFLDAFEDRYAWVRGMKLEERFTDTGVNARVPIGPTGPEQRKDNFLQRDGIPTIIITAIRERDNQEFEVGLPFTLANDTPLEVTQSMLASAASSLIVAERMSNGN